MYLARCTALFRVRVLLSDRHRVVRRQQSMSSGLCLPSRDGERNLNTLLSWILLSRWYGDGDGKRVPRGLLRPCWCVIMHAVSRGAVRCDDSVDDTDVQWTVRIGLHLCRWINVCQPCELVRLCSK